MTIERLIEGLHERSNAQLAEMRRKGLKRRAASPDDAEIHRFIAAIDVEFQRRVSPPENGWTRGTQGEPRYLMQDGRRVAAVQRMDTHRQSNGDVYFAEILGQPLQDWFRHVDDARIAVEKALSENAKPNSS